MQHTPLASSPDVLSLSLPFPFPPPPLHAATVVMAHVPLLLISRGEHHGVDIIIILPCEVVRLPSSSCLNALDPLARYLDRGLSVSFYSDTYPNNFAEVRISSPPPVVMILSFSEGQKSLCILRAGTVEASVTQLHFDFEQQDAVKLFTHQNRPFDYNYQP